MLDRKKKQLKKFLKKKLLQDMFVKRIGEEKPSPPPPFKRIQLNQSNPNKTTQPASSSDNGSHQPTLDLSSKDKSVKRELPSVAFTNAAHIYCPVQGLTIEERRRAPAISGIKCGSQEYWLTDEAAAPSLYAMHNPNNNKIVYDENKVNNNGGLEFIYNNNKDDNLPFWD